MNLEETIQDIQQKLKHNSYPNEQAISQGIVLPLVRGLGWDDSDPQTVTPEYTAGKGRVDYALFVQKGREPSIFIEVKFLGNIAGADEQVFQYAYHQGVPFLIVTDGNEWHFYLSTAAGNYDKRQVYKLDLLEREAQESATRLKRYLTYSEVKNGEALKKAQEDHQNITREGEAKNAIPEAWQKLLTDKDELLIEIVIEKVESLCGSKPKKQQVLDYLASLKEFKSNSNAIEKGGKKEGHADVAEVYKLESKKHKIKAKMYKKSEGEFVVLTDSRVKKDDSKSFSNKLKDLKQDYISKGILKDEGGYYIFTKDTTFTSPSQAAGMILGYSANGRKEWKSE